MPDNGVYTEAFLGNPNEDTFTIYSQSSSAQAQNNGEVGLGTLLGVLTMPLGYMGHFQDIFSGPPTVCAGNICQQSWTGARVGQTFGKLGTVVENPGLKITGFTEHGINQVITRGVSPDALLETVANPSAVLQQSAGQYLYLSDQAAVVLDPTGQLVTAYPSSMFDSNVQGALDGVGINEIP